MSKFRKAVVLLMAVLLIVTLAVGCGGSRKDATSNVTSSGIGVLGNIGNDTSTEVSLVLGSGTILTDDFDNMDNWEFLNGATGSISGGVLTVTAPSAEGIAMKLKDSVWTAMGSPTSYYVEMLLKPTGLPTGNKNIGIASNIQSNTEWYYAGFNSNGRMQAGYSGNLKGYQNTSDGTRLSSSDDFVYYKWRYENNNGTINFYCNDLFMGKNNLLANYNPNQGYAGPIGVYSCGASFEVAAVRMGLISENQTKLIIETADQTFPRLWAKYLRWINNTSSTGIRVGDAKEFTITATKADGTADTWTAASTDSGVLTVSSSSGASGEKLTITGAGVGKATVTVVNVSDPNSKRTITYEVKQALSYVADNYGDISGKVYPSVGAMAAYADGALAIDFDSAPVIANVTGEIFINKYIDDTTVDTINLSNATESAFKSDRGSDLNIGDQMVRIEGNTLYITPHFGKLADNTQYYVAIPNQVITGTLNGQSFTGFSPSNKTWNFTTRPAPSITGTVITVDGSRSSAADFRTVQAALQYASNNSLEGAEIRIAPGTYHELLTFKKDINLTLKGMGTGDKGNDVVIKYINGNSMNGSTSSRPVTYFSTTKTLTLLNLTLENPAAKSQVAQAEVIYFNSDNGKLIAKNCSFLSEQDTILTKGYNWFKDCYIEGSTDFIWGYAIVSLFEDCQIKCIEPGSVICHARCLQTSKGYVFLNCNIDSTSGESKLARDMSGTESDYDNISFINCTVNGNLKWDDQFQPTPASQLGPLTGWKYYGWKY